MHITPTYYIINTFNKEGRKDHSPFPNTPRSPPFLALPQSLSSSAIAINFLCISSCPYSSLIKASWARNSSVNIFVIHLLCENSKPTNQSVELLLPLTALWHQLATTKVGVTRHASLRYGRRLLGSETWWPDCWRICLFCTFFSKNQASKVHIYWPVTL